MKRAFLIFTAILSALGCASETTVSGDILLGGSNAGNVVVASVPVNAFLRTEFSKHINGAKAAALPEIMSVIREGADCENRARAGGNGTIAERTERCRAEEEAASI